MLLPSIIFFVLCLVLSAFFSSSETAFMAVNPFALESREKQGSRRARLARRVLGRVNELLATILIGNTLANAAAASVATAVFAAFFRDRNKAVIFATVTTTLLLLIFSELTPKTYAAHNPLKLALSSGPPLKGFMMLFYPLVKALAFVTGLLVPSAGKSGRGGPALLNEDEVRLMFRAGAGGLSVLRRRMISGALDIGSRPVRDIIVPRPQVKALPVDATLEEVIAAIQASGFSRYPVYRGRLDNIEGVLHAKDLIAGLAGGGSRAFDLKSLLKRPFFLPEAASLEHALLEMQKNSVHMAIIVDEFGSVEGIVTLEDILEEVVGDIRDEHDGKTRELITVMDETNFLVEGAAPVKEVNERLKLGLPEKSDYSTLAGFFLARFGRLPRENDHIDHDGWRLRVEKMHGRRIALIFVSRPAAGGQGKK
jgi:putative hemolysin